jgi:hypothetical protein
MQDQNPKPNPRKLDKWAMATLAFEMGYIIALPLVLFGLAGKYLDGRLGTEPWLALAGVLLAIGVTTVWLIRKLKDYLK